MFKTCGLPFVVEDWMQWFGRVKWRNARPTSNHAYVPTDIEHIANIITHGVWIVPSVWGTADLILRSPSWQHIASALVYGTALVLVFLMSTFFHSVHYCGHNRQLKDVLHRTDRAMIYVFIAASYFPWLTLGPIVHIGLASQLWWVVWILAFLGILYQQLFHERYKTLETLFYCFMGLAPASAIVATTDFHGLTELKIGGFIYMLGVVFFKSDGAIPCAHAIWHLHVAVAAATHYYAIQKYLYP